MLLRAIRLKYSQSKHIPTPVFSDQPSWDRKGALTTKVPHVYYHPLILWIMRWLFRSEGKQNWKNKTAFLPSLGHSEQPATTAGSLLGFGTVWNTPDEELHSVWRIWHWKPFHPYQEFSSHVRDIWHEVDDEFYSCNKPYLSYCKKYLWSIAIVGSYSQINYKASIL